ncbi:acyl-CoA dehydrogenase, C-terminal domain protein [Mycobacterium xenopi 4042]|uniref:Acyl-CoA dehydrogenase, C-terminal domain protein n=1 Tax=Mycobacterium xenopi 4042 TaxID=1299334 RepID=X8AHV9_MYCXE|nr:acyl-CoA dehydrogenase, C-terminal domain protein [Mycobacterium xenopi 4042]
MAGSRLTGTLPLIAGAPAAELLLVLAKETDSGNPVLVAVDPSDDAVDVVPHQPFDLTATIGSVTLHQASGELLGAGSAVREALEAARRRAVLAVAADSVGVGSRALAMAVAWAGEREQFGRPIGSFQAISHRCADMLVELEGARSQVLAAADELDSRALIAWSIWPQRRRLMPRWRLARA